MARAGTRERDGRLHRLLIPFVAAEAGTSGDWLNGGANLNSSRSNLTASQILSVVPAKRAKSAFTRVFDALWRAKSRDPYRRAGVYGSRVGATLRVAWPGRQQCF